AWKWRSKSKSTDINAPRAISTEHSIPRDPGNADETFGQTGRVGYCLQLRSNKDQTMKQNYQHEKRQREMEKKKKKAEKARKKAGTTETPPPPVRN
ncbi:MAG: hypothetical protein R3F27_09340, partial [Gammaproteobacteria bacterium]